MRPFEAMASGAAVRHAPVRLVLLFVSLARAASARSALYLLAVLSRKGRLVAVVETTVMSPLAPMV